jgi:hypothetical protein
MGSGHTTLEVILISFDPLLFDVSVIAWFHLEDLSQVVGFLILGLGGIEVQGGTLQRRFNDRKKRIS